MRVVAPSSAKTRRRNLEIYFKTNHVQVERILELDTMMGSLDFVAASDWVTIVPALMMNGDIERANIQSVRSLARPPRSISF